jgi:hypothetical protein
VRYLGGGVGMKIKNANEIVKLIDLSCKRLPFRYDDSVRKLMLGTAACESLLTIRVQTHGPARGLWQCEPNTVVSIYKDFLRYRPAVYKVFSDSYGDTDKFSCPSKSIIEYRLVNYDDYACMIARCKYAWDKEAIPHDLADIAKYYKRVYNTYMGKGSAERFLQIYYRLHCDRLIEEAGPIATS